MIQKLKYGILLLVTGLLMTSCATTETPVDQDNSTPYALIFDGFSDDDMDMVEGRLLNLDGYFSHKLTESSSLNHKYQYNSTLTSAPLNRALRGMLRNLDIVGTVDFSGNKYTIHKTPNTNPPQSLKEEWKNIPGEAVDKAKQSDKEKLKKKGKKWWQKIKQRVKEEDIDDEDIETVKENLFRAIGD